MAHFGFPDVPAGTYELEIRLRDRNTLNAPRGSDRSPELGSIKREIIVPESNQSTGAEPLDLGQLELVPQTTASTR